MHFTFFLTVYGAEKYNIMPILGGVRHCQDGGSRAALCELQNCSSETCGYIHLYVQSVNNPDDNPGFSSTVQL